MFHFCEVIAHILNWYCSPRLKVLASVPSISTQKPTIQLWCFFFSFFSFPQDRISPCSPSCPGTHSVDQVGLKLKEILLLSPECWEVWAPTQSPKVYFCRLKTPVFNSKRFNLFFFLILKITFMYSVSQEGREKSAMAWRPGDNLQKSVFFSLIGSQGQINYSKQAWWQVPSCWLNLFL